MPVSIIWSGFETYFEYFIHATNGKWVKVNLPMHNVPNISLKSSESVFYLRCYINTSSLLEVDV